MKFHSWADTITNSSETVYCTLTGKGLQVTQAAVEELVKQLKDLGDPEILIKSEPMDRDELIGRIEGFLDGAIPKMDESSKDELIRSMTDGLLGELNNRMKNPEVRDWRQEFKKIAKKIPPQFGFDHEDLIDYLNDSEYPLSDTISIWTSDGKKLLDLGNLVYGALEAGVARYG